jgi:hypothetical protein
MPVGCEDQTVAADRISYATFGERFFEHAVTEERILDALGGLAGDPIEFGPIGAGPGRIAQVRAHGEVGQADVRRTAGDDVSFHLTIPVALDLDIDLLVDHHRFHAAVTVNLVLTARAADPLRIVIDIPPPTARDVTVVVDAEGLRATVLQYVAGIDREIARFVAKYVARELDKPHILAARDIDVAARIDKAWPS